MLMQPSAFWPCCFTSFHCQLIQPFYVNLTRWDLFPLPQTLGTQDPPPMSQESLVLLHVWAVYTGRVWGLSYLTADMGTTAVLAYRDAQWAQNLAPELRNGVKLGTETFDLLFIFWKLVETAVSEEDTTGVSEVQKYFILIIQPGTAGLVKFLFAPLLLLLLRNAAAAESFKKIFSPYKNWKYQTMAQYLEGGVLV